jgi:hypothetical protein
MTVIILLHVFYRFIAGPVYPRLQPNGAYASELSSFVAETLNRAGTRVLSGVLQLHTDAELGHADFARPAGTPPCPVEAT